LTTPTVNKELSGPPRKAFYELSSNPGAVQEKGVLLPIAQRQVRGATLRKSGRWIEQLHVVRNWFEIPHIDRLGRFTGRSIYTWQCRPADVFTTTVSTVASRLKRYAASHNSSQVVGKHLRSILRASVYYVLTHNSYFMDRILYFLRNLGERGKLIHRLTLKFLIRCDADKRFVYSRACFHANWLLFRARGPRDKSHQKFRELDTIYSRDLGLGKGWIHTSDIRARATETILESIGLARPKGVFASSQGKSKLNS